MSINLMPWREARRKQLQKDFLSKIGLSALVAVGVVVVGALATSSLISGEKNRIQYLQKNITAAEKDIEEIKTLEKKREQQQPRQPQNSNECNNICCDLHWLRPKSRCFEIQIF